MNSHRGLLHHLIITISDVSRSAPFYGPMFRYMGYELAGSKYGDGYEYEDWKRWDLDTPHEISLVKVDPKLTEVAHVKGAVGHHHHLAFCAGGREDVDRFYAEVLVPCEKESLCVIEDPPCLCPEYGGSYYATFFKDLDGLKYEYVSNKSPRKEREGAGPHLGQSS